MRHNRAILFIIITNVVILLLAGCVPILSTDMSLNIGLLEQWTFDVIVVPVQGFGGDQAVIDTLNSQFANDENLKNLGIIVTVEEQPSQPDGTTPIKMSLQGKGYDTFNQAFNENVFTIDDSSGQRLLRFNMSSNLDSTVQSTSFTLSGGKILNHNGTLLDDHTIVWRNYTGNMQATMVEPSLLDYWLYIGVATILCMTVAFLILVTIGLRRLSKVKKAKTRQLVHEKTCVQCGSIIPANAVFCPNCGAQQN